MLDILFVLWSESLGGLVCLNVTFFGCMCRFLKLKQVG